MSYSGEDTKKLGFGLMRLPMKNDSIDMEQLKEMVDMFIEHGFTYFDTAWMYCNFKSQSAAKEALVSRYPRDRFTLATKLHNGFFNSLEERDKIFNAQLEQTGAGYFDYYLIHGIDEGSYKHYLKFDCFNWLREKKKQGLVKHMGFSFHDTPRLLDEILSANPDTEFVQLQINYLDWESPWVHSRGIYEVARRHNVPIIVMEPVKGGTLAKLPPQAEKLFTDYDPERSASSWAIRFAASLDGVMTVLSGMSDMAQMKDNLSYMEDFKPLTEEEKAICFKAADIINGKFSIPCTGCSYCTAGCPQNIAIPQYFSLYNEIMREDMEHKGWTVSFSNYSALAENHGKAKDCIACGQCERACPQHIDIIENLKHVSERFDG